MEGIEVKDLGLKNYINLKPMLIPKTFGRHAKKQFHKSEDVNIVERLMNHLFVPGHRGKKHFKSSGQCVGKTMTALNIIKDSFDIVEKETKQNPVQVLVTAIENSALREEITSFKMGGMSVRKAVIASPQRRVDLALRVIAQSSFQRATKGKKMAQALAEELIAAYKQDSSRSNAIKEKERVEREAAGAR